jgi:hypothetical protein
MSVYAFSMILCVCMEYDFVCVCVELCYAIYVNLKYNFICV